VQRRILIWAAAIALAAATGAAAAGLLPGRFTVAERSEGADSTADAEEVVLRVNGVPVTSEEFRFWMKEETGAVTTYFKTKYGAEDGLDYWTTSRGGEVPLDMLKQRARQRAVEGKVLQELGKEQGLLADISFSRIKQDWEAYNEARERNRSQGGIVYGPAQFDFTSFYHNVMDHLRLELKKRLGERELAVSEAEARAYYDAHPERYTRRTLSVSELVVPYEEEDKEEARRTAERARQELAAGQSAETVARRLGGGAYARERTLIAADASGGPPNAAADSAAVAAGKLTANEWSDVVDTGGAFSLIRLLKVGRNAAVPFAEAEDRIAALLLEQKFDAFVAQRVRTAAVDVATDVYAGLQAR